MTEAELQEIEQMIDGAKDHWFVDAEVKGLRFGQVRGLIAEVRRLRGEPGLKHAGLYWENGRLVMYD